MGREAMGLTLEDLEVLRTLVRARPRSHRAAANVVGISRARLSRLIQRVDQKIGEDLDWRENGRFYPPQRSVGWFPSMRRLLMN